MKWIIGLFINLQFFTSIPIKWALPMEVEHLKHAIRLFPLLGLIQGAILLVVSYALMEWTPFSSLAIAFIIWLVSILITGGLHLDGWMDTSDAFFSYQDKDKRLEIMDDPRAGAFAVLSVIILLASKFFFLYEVVQMATVFFYPTLLLIPFFGKMTMGLLLIYTNAAKETGLAAYFQQAVHIGMASYYVAFAGLCGILLAVFQPSMLAIYSILLFSVCLYTLFVIRKVKQHFGGITGDLLGAGTEGVELFLWMIVWLLHYFVIL